MARYDRAGRSGPIASVMVHRGGRKLGCKAAPVPPDPRPESWKVCSPPVGHLREGSIWDFDSRVFRPEKGAPSLRKVLA